ncbi:hypothetical protein [Streptomyces sp. NPDC053755]|uniref:hypothetical protein n=1 Tax=Streptomyces sp. NPDC053755 TaxID=3155815 RepID=UPI0034388BB8
MAESRRAGPRHGAAGSRRLTDFAVIAVARADEPAASTVFASALETALARLSLSRKQRYLSVEQVVDTVDDIYRSAGVRQTARAHVETEGYALLSFEHTGYRLGCAVRDLEWVDDERLAVHTVTGVLCLRLP